MTAHAPNNKVRLGGWVTAPHPTIVELMASQDFDWICIDLEHSPVSRLELQTAISIIQGKGKKAFVRVPYNSHLEIKYPLDSGVDGVIIPMVNSAAEAKQAVAASLYPPKGNRGVGLARAQGFGFSFEEHLKKNQTHFEIILQIEHIQAVQDITSIVSLDGVTGIFLGPYDLSGSMGIPGELEHPRMKEAIQKVADATRKSGKQLGCHVIPAASAKVMDYAALGYNFIAFSLDTIFLGQKIKDELAQVRSQLTR